MRCKNTRRKPRKARATTSGSINHQYLQRKSNDQIALEFREILRAKGHQCDIFRIEALVALVKERVSFVKEIWDQVDFFFSPPETYDKEVIKKRWKDETPGQLTELRSVLESCDEFTVSATEATVKSWIEKKKYNTGAIMNAFRLVIVGASRGPHMFDIISWIGRDETLRRIEKGIAVIGKK